VQKEIAATYKYAVSLDPDVMTCSIDDWCLADSIPHVQIKEWIFLQSLENIVAPQFHALLCQARSQKMEGPTDLRALGMELNMNDHELRGGKTVHESVLLDHLHWN